MDIRLRLFVSDKLHNLHVLAVPMTEKHTVLAIFEIVQNFFRSLVGDDCSTKLLPAATDVASNMTGRY